jgi:hypothetical protein
VLLLAAGARTAFGARGGPPTPFAPSLRTEPGAALDNAACIAFSSLLMQQLGAWGLLRSLGAEPVSPAPTVPRDALRRRRLGVYRAG